MFAINDRFLVLRKELGLTQEEFAAKAHRTRSEIKNIEYKKTLPKDELVASVCAAYGVREEWLRYGIEPMKAPRSEEEEIAEMVGAALTGSSKLKKAVVRLICSKSEAELLQMEADLRKLYESLDK